MVRVGKEVLPGHRVHPPGTLFDERHITRKVVQHASNVVISRNRNLVIESIVRIGIRLFVFGIAPEELPILPFEVLGLDRREIRDPWLIGGDRRSLVTFSTDIP